MIEIFGFITGVVNVWLLARQNIWNWPIGIANNLAYLILFASSGLYGDSGLQFVYIALGVYGWWLWLHRASGYTLRVSRTSSRVWLQLVVARLSHLEGIFDYFRLETGVKVNAFSSGISKTAAVKTCPL